MARGVTANLDPIECRTCSRVFTPNKPRQQYCQLKCRPSSRSIAVRMSPEAALALEAAHFAVQRQRKRMTQAEFEELFEARQERQEDIYLDTGRVIPLELLAE